MLHVGDAVGRNCRGPTRRAILQVGGLGVLGLTLADWFRAAAAAPGPARRDVSCIFLWLDGGPSHFETFDPKPNTPDTIRGPYGTVPTAVPGVHFCELMPLTARHMDKCALIRSLTHKNSNHTPVPMLTGFDDKTTSYGAVVTKLKGFAGDMPPYVHLGSKLAVGGGALGAAFDPLQVADPGGGKAALPNMTLSANVPAERFLKRNELLASIDAARARLHASPEVARLDSSYQRAVNLLTSAKVRTAFDLKHEPDDLRNRYGANFFGSACLTARRLVEAGTRFVQVKWYDGPAFDGWDVHGADLAGMARMEQHLCPRLDQALSALLQDLHDRRLLDSTLVVATGEFGRTPTINKYGARDHWPYCFSVLLAGGGVPGGMAYGASDREGAYPANNPVKPPEFAATLYKLMGIDTNTDPRVRPYIGPAVAVGDFF